MHVYVYDTRLENAKYHQTLARIETRLTDLGLNGKIVRLNPMHNLERTIRDELRPDCTIVLVGNDSLVNMAINILIGHEALIGIIPIGKDNNSIATSLGIEPELAACDTLSARRIIHADIGVANESAFLNQLNITTNHALIDVDSNLSLEIEAPTEINVSNLVSLDLATDNKSSHEDGLLELTMKTLLKKGMFTKAETSQTFIQKNNFLVNGDFTALADNSTEIKAPVKISVLPKALKIIVGRKKVI